MKKKQAHTYMEVPNFLGGTLYIVVRRGGLPNGSGYEVICELVTARDMKTVLLDIPTYAVMNLGVGETMTQQEIQHVVNWLVDLTPSIIESADYYLA